MSDFDNAIAIPNTDARPFHLIGKAIYFAG
jgi:hypothetical protein